MSRPYYNNYKDITLLARELRKRQTASEKLVWEVLKSRQISGLKFLRQHPVFYRIDKGWRDFYIADFYCRELKIIIELDGLIHETQIAYDAERDKKLEAKGIQVVRIKNEELFDINAFIAFIKQVIKLRSTQLSKEK